MGFIAALIGAAIGVWMMDASRDLFGVSVGFLIGWLIHRLVAAQTTIRALTNRVDNLEQRNAATAPIIRSEQKSIEPKPRVSIHEPIADDTAENLSPENSSFEPEFTSDSVPQFAAKAQTPASPSPVKPRPGISEHTINVAKRWLTTGNVPVKVGIIISFFGVAFLLKFAVENSNFSIPMSVRYLGVAGFAAILLFLGWRMRQSNRVYGLSLQGGGIGVLYLTVFAAFRLHGLLPPTIAFALLILITAASGFLAIKQESRAFAILGTTGGFLAPLLVSTGSGNHVGLFSYYLILNCAVLGIAWFRSWRELNIIGFVFTFGVGIIWGHQYYVPELFTTTEPFLVLYFLFYTAIAVLFALRQSPKLRGYVDGTLVFGTPTIAFALQSELLDDSKYGLAISAAIVAAFYAALALWLRRTQEKNFDLLTQAFIALAVAFGTVAIPLALDDRWTAIAWALEGAALVWIGVRQSTTLAKISGAALAFAGGTKFLSYGWVQDLGFPVLNGNYMGGALIAVSALFSARLLRTDANARDWQKAASLGLLFWGLGWWFGTGVIEIFDRLSWNTRLHTLLLFVSISFAGIAFAGKHFRWIAYRRVALALLPALMLGAVAYLVEYDHFFEGLGGFAWLVALLSHLWVLYCYGNDKSRATSVTHTSGAVFFIGLVALEIYWRIDQLVTNDVWAATAGLLTLGAGAFALFSQNQQRRWPLGAHYRAYFVAAATLCLLYLMIVVGLCIDNPGNPSPLPYIPLFNPLGVVSIVGLALAWFGTKLERRHAFLGLGANHRARYYLLGAAAWLLSTIAVVRAVHHFTGVPWYSSALMNSVAVQSTLSIYWAVLGLSSMVLGTRRANRTIWMLGAALMGVVVLKLFVIDLGNTGTVARIVSFLGVGVMLLVVGYFSPVPPKSERAGDE